MYMLASTSLSVEASTFVLIYKFKMLSKLHFNLLYLLYPDFVVLPLEIWDKNPQESVINLTFQNTGVYMVLSACISAL